MAVFIDDEDVDRVLLAGPWYVEYYADGKVKCVAASRKGNRPKLHRFVLNLMPGDPDVDHRDRNPLNNQKNNLRLAEQKFNQQNRSPRGNKNNTSGYRGVAFHKPSGLWHARQHLNGKMHSIGYFRTAEAANDAAVAWRSAHYSHAEECA